jgi:hypothetical protein
MPGGDEVLHHPPSTSPSAAPATDRYHQTHKLRKTLAVMKCCTTHHQHHPRQPLLLRHHTNANTLMLPPLLLSVVAAQTVATAATATSLGLCKLLGHGVKGRAVLKPVDLQKGSNRHSQRDTSGQCGCMMHSCSQDT